MTAAARVIRPNVKSAAPASENDPAELSQDARSARRERPAPARFPDQSPDQQQYDAP